MEKTTQDSHLSKMAHYQQRISENILEVRIQIIDLMKSVQSYTNNVNQFKIDPFSFKELFELASSDLNVVFLDMTQKMMLLDISREVSGIVPLHDFVIRGFILRAIKNWQASYNKPIIILTKMNQLERFKIGAEILYDARNLISKGIYINNEKTKQLVLCNMYQAMLDRYEELISVLKTIADITVKNPPTLQESHYF